MANNRVKINCDIDADIGQAKKAINDLQQSIEKLSKAQINTDYLDKGINNAVGAAKELQFHLNAALNQNTGKINLNAFTQSLQQSNTSAKDLMQTLLQGGAAGQQTFTALASAIAQSEVPLKRANKTLQDFATTLKNTIKWEISSTMVHGLESALSGAVSYAKNLNTSLTNIRIVTGQTVEDMTRFTREANAAAKALSTTTKAYADASLIYYQQGDSQEMAAKKAAITIKASNASFETSAKEMSEYLTAVWNSYQVGADELERYVDIMANLGAKTATSLEEIATSMQKVAATANTVGVSMEQVSSIIATVSSVTRESAESIGTSYKTIFARIGDLKLGKVDEDGVGLGQVSSQLDAIGIKILDGSGNLREMGDIIMDLGNKWQTMNQAQKTAVAQVVAGKRQYTQLMALFENWDMFQGNMNIAENSDGALQKMQDTYAESWEGASARAQAAIEGIYSTILNDQAIIKMINGLADLTTGLNNVIEGFGGLGGVITTLGGLAMRVFKQQISSSIDDTLGKFTKWSSQFKGQGFFEIGKKIATSSAKSAEQIKHEDEQARWQSYMKEMKVSTESESVALNNSAELLNMKERLIDAEYRLTDAQKSRAQYELAVLSQEQERLLALTQEREQMDEQVESKTRQAKAVAARAVVRDTEGETNENARARLDAIFSDTKAGTYEGALKMTRENAEKIDLFSNFRSELEKVKGDSEAVQKIVQKMKNIFGEDFEAEFLDNATQDTDKLIRRLQDLEKATEKANKELTEQIDTDKLGKEAKDTVRKQFDDMYEEGKQRATLRLGEQGVSQNIGGIKKTLTDLFDADSKVSKSLGNTLATVADLGMSAAGAFYDGAEAIRIMNDESATLGDTLGFVASAATNLATSFASGGIWGLAITAVVGAISAAIAYFEQKKKEYQEEQTKDFKKTVEETDEKDIELSNIKTLIKNYNTLKETYTSTGEGQDALAKSARELAEAYGLVGTSLLIAEGNFSQFESAIIGSLGLGQMKAFYQNKIDETNKALMDQSIDSAYRMEAQSRDMKTHGQTYNFTKEQNQAFRDQAALFSPETVGETGRKIALGKNIQAAIDSLIVPLFDMPKLEGTNAFSSDNWAKINQASLAYLSQGLGAQGLTDANKIMLDIAKGIPASLEGRSQGQILGEYPALMQLHRGRLVDSQIQALTAESNPSYIKPEDMKELEILFQEQVDSSVAAQQNILIDEFVRVTGASYDKEQDGLMGIDYLAPLMTNNKFDPYNYKGGPVQWYSDRETAILKVQEEEAAIRAELEKKELDPILKDWYNGRLEELGVVKNYLDNLGDQDYLEAYNASQDWQKQLNDLENIENLIVKKMFGHSEQDTSFTNFFGYMQELEKDVEAMAVQDDRFAGLVDQTTGKALAGKEDQFNAVRDQIAAGYVSDLTAFDDFLAVYQAIADTFSTEQMPQVQAFIDAANIKDARLISSNLLNTMLADIKNGQSLVNEQGQLVEGTDTSKILAYNQKLQAADESKARYDSFININSKFKENLGLDDSIALYELLIKNFDDGNNAWSDFVQMDYDQKKAYLEAREDTILSLTKSSYQGVVDSAKLNLQEVYGLTEQEIEEILTGTNANYTDRKAAVDSFVAAGFSLDKETNTYIDRNDQIYDAQKFGGKTYNEMLSEQSWVTGVGSAIGEITSAEKIIQAIIMMEGAIPGLVQQIQTLSNDFENFNKTGKVSANVLKQMAEWGINGATIKNAEDYLEVIEQIYEAAKGNTSGAKKKYDEELQKLGVDSIDWSIQKNQEDYSEAWSAYKEYLSLLGIEEEVLAQLNISKENYTNKELERGQKLLAQMEERKSKDSEEAEKIKVIAETLSSSIDSSYLTETQKLNMSPELISQWESASSAVERGAIAAKMWTNYATQITAAGEASAIAYTTAQTELDNLFNNWDVLQKEGAFEGVKFNFADIDSGNFKSFIQKNINNSKSQAIWNKAFDELASKTDLSTMTDYDILQAVKQQIGETADLAEAEFDQIMAGVKDSIVQTYAQLGEQEASLAQQVVDDWESAFRQIADLRRSIIIGEDIGSDLTASLEDYVRYANAYTGEGSLAAAYKSGKLTANQMALGSDKELTEKLLASMGLSNDGYDLFAEYTDGLHLKEMSLLARQFGITKDEERFKIDGKFDQKLYENAIREAAKPFLQNLLLQSGMDATTANQLLSEFMLGSDTAIETINQAANKMLDVSEEYSQLLTDNEKLAEADAAYQKYTEEEKKKQQEFLDYADATEAITELEKGQRTEETIAGILADKGITQEDYIAKLQEKGYDVSTLADIGQLSDQTLLNIENSLQEDAAQAGRNIIAAGEAFAGIVTGIGANGEAVSGGTIGDYSTDESLGFGKDSVAGQQAQEYIDETEKALDNLLGTFQEDAEDDYESQLGKYNLNADEVDEYGDSLQGAAKSSEDLADGLADDAEAADKLAQILMRAERAVTEIKESYKEWTKVAKDSTRTFQETQKLAKEVKKNLNDLMDLEEDYFDLSKEEDLGFLTDPDTINLMKDIANGVEGAEDKMIASLTKFKGKALGLSDEIIDAWTLMGQELNDLPAGTEIEIGSDARVSPEFHNALNTAIASLYDANGELAVGVNEANSILGALGDGAGFDVEVVDATNAIPGETYYKPITTMMPLGADGGQVPVITGWEPVTSPDGEFNGVAYKVTNKKGSYGGKVGSGGSKGSGGGGGEKKKEKKEKLRARDEIPRYHTNEKVLESIESVLTEIDKLKDRAYGADHIKQLDAETEALKRQLKAQQALKEEAESYIPQDRGEFLSYGAQFDADGVIINYESVMQSIMDEYNEAIEEYNNSAQEDSDKERLEDAKQKYDDLKDSIEKYEEAIQKAQDAANEMLEIENQMSELELEKVTYKLELEIEVNDTELEIIDYYKTKYEESLKDQDEYFGKLIEANAVYEDNLIHLRTAEEELNAKYRAGLINDADYAEGLADIQSQMIDNLKNIEELKKDISEVYENTLEMAREQIEEITDLIDGSISSIESYISILELSGREKDYDTLKDLYEALYQNNFALIDINKAHLDSLKAEEEALLRKYNGDSEAMSEADKERHMVLRAQIQETQEALNEATEATLETLRSGFEVVIQSIGDELDHFMAGASTSLAHLQEQYDYYTETQERYVSAAKELYEVSKLNRDIENSLTTATSSAAKEALKALQEKINKQSELNELTEYDIEMNQLQYQLLLARIKLEETQNAKDIVRLTRDENGNYAYRYTANQDKIDEAAQHYEDVLQQINDLTVQRTSEIESQILSTMQNYKEKLMEISLDYSLTEEERLLKLEELNAQYAETMQYLQEQNNIVTQNLTDNQSAIAEHYGANISSITASTAGNVNSSVQSMIDKANEYIAAMSNAIYGEGGILSNWQGYEEKIDAVNKASGTSYESLREEAKATTEMLEGFENQAVEIISTLENTLVPLSELTQAWDDHGIELDTITSKYESLVEAIQATRNAMDNFGDSSSLITDVNKMPDQQSNYAGLSWFDGSQFNPMGMGFGMGMGMNNPMMAWPSLDQNTINYLMTNTKVTTESMMSALNNLYHAPSVMYDRNNENQVLTQDVRITAEFPSVTDRNEIEEALLGLANRASQFASRQKK